MNKIYPIIRKNEWLHDVGWGNGYVILPEGHPWYGIGYDNIPLYIHGGLTYSMSIKSNPKLINICENLSDENLPSEGWVIGFDTSHYGDNIDNCDKNFVISETKRLYEECMSDEYEEILKWKRKVKIENIDSHSSIG